MAGKGKYLKVRVGDLAGPVVTITAPRRIWALGELMRAGPRGCTSLQSPAPRWSAYIFALRHEHGIDIAALEESHAGQFSGSHARYILRSTIEVLARSEGFSDIPAFASGTAAPTPSASPPTTRPRAGRDQPNAYALAREGLAPARRCENEIRPAVLERLTVAMRQRWQAGERPPELRNAVRLDVPEASAAEISVASDDFHSTIRRRA